MSRQAGLFNYAAARWSDPETSRQAAESISFKTLSETQARVLALVRMYGPITDEQLVERFRESYGEHISEQSIRSRRAELAKAGHVEVAGKSLTARQRPCRTWRAA